MKTFILLLMLVPMIALSKQPSVYKIDFGDACGACDWFVVVDGVMGGRSTGSLATQASSVVLSGTISLANRGGFSSIRTPYGRYDLSGFETVEIRYRSIGQSFAFTLNNFRRFYRPKFKHVLPVSNGEWRTAKLSLSDFKKVRLSQPLDESPSKEELAKIIRLGLISNDKQAGEFELEVDYIEFN